MRLLILSVLITAFAGMVSAQETLPGKQTYVENCLDCHGENGEGDDDAAPDIRGANRTALERALPGFDQMPEFDLTEEEIQALQAYLSELDS